MMTLKRSRRAHDHVLQTAHIRRRPTNPLQGLMSVAGRTLPVALGRSGTSVFKREGDGATPVGRWTARQVWVRPARTPRRAARLPLYRITHDDGWCDASGTRHYNGHVRLPHAASHEVMARDDHLYDTLVVTSHNEAGHRHLGSAVFVHLARPGYTPTEGCIALARPHMTWLVERLGPSSGFQVHR